MGQPTLDEEKAFLTNQPSPSASPTSRSHLRPILLLLLLPIALFFPPFSFFPLTTSSSTSSLFPPPRALTFSALSDAAGYASHIRHLHHSHDGKSVGRPGWKKSPTAEEAEQEMLKVPTEESARRASHSFTAAHHIAGTTGDKTSALRVKSQWEYLLGIPVTDPDVNVFESGSKESKKALMGEHWDKKKQFRTGSCGGKKDWKLKKGVKKVFNRLMKRSRSRKDELHKSSSKPRVWVDTYYPLLTHPLPHSSISLYPLNSTTPSYVASLKEDALPLDPTSAIGSSEIPPFHGFSKNGTARGKLVYAGRGSKAEFDALVEAGVELKGSVVIVQYGGSFRGLKVRAAQNVGAVGIIIYTDPIEDGTNTVENGIEPYPSGPARQPSSVQRGSVQFLSIYPGDPLTPGTPAYKSTSRLPPSSPLLNIPTIPSLPISYTDALPLLRSLNSKGIKFDNLTWETTWERGEGWKEGGLGYEGVEYWTGPGEEEVELVNLGKEGVQEIWNTMAVIPGRLEEEVVVLGNHNDAWTFGAGDPNSGTAAVHEIVKTLGVLLEKGWKPLRTIVVASWDAEEYGLIGSTEFGEDYATYLSSHVVAYLNVDVAVSGTNYGVGASPSLAGLFRDVSALVEDPDTDGEGNMLERLWRDGLGEEPEEGVVEEKNLDLARVGPLGSGSDYTVFLQYLGLASANIGFSRKRTDPVYHYHSIYDSAYWMDNFGDPTFKRHVVVSKVLGLALLRLADSIILPINVTAYAHELSTYVDKVKSLSSNLTSTLNFAPLENSILHIQSSASLLSLETSTLLSSISSNPFPHPLPHQLHHLRSINHRLRSFEKGFVTPLGLPEREWYRSRVVAPGRYLGYGATTLPALTEAITLDQDVEYAKDEVERLTALFEEVAKKLLRK